MTGPETIAGGQGWPGRGLGGQSASTRSLLLPLPQSRASRSLRGASHWPSPGGGTAKGFGIGTSAGITLWACYLGGDCLPRGMRHRRRRFPMLQKSLHGIGRVALAARGRRCFAHQSGIRHPKRQSRSDCHGAYSDRPRRRVRPRSWQTSAASLVHFLSPRSGNTPLVAQCVGSAVARGGRGRADRQPRGAGEDGRRSPCSATRPGPRRHASAEHSRPSARAPSPPRAFAPPAAHRHHAPHAGPPPAPPPGDPPSELPWQDA